MIVGTYFDGDNDDTLKWQQHDCYREALSIIAYDWREDYRNAAIMHGRDSISLPERFDHRTLQAAHDYLAAWWRWKHNRTDSYFEGLEQVTVEDWIVWLKREVTAWPTQAPHTIQLVVRVLLNQNTDVGYAAEDALQEELCRCYTGMVEVEIGMSQAADPIQSDDSIISPPEPEPNTPAWPTTKCAAEDLKEKQSNIKKWVRYFLRSYPIPSNAILLIIAFGGIFSLSILMNHLFEAVGWRVDLSNSEEGSVAGLPSYAIIAAASLAILNLYMAFMWFVDPKNEEETNAMRGNQNAMYLAEARPLILAVPYTLGCAIVSAIIDVTTSYYFYQEDSNSFLLAGLTCVYIGSAFLIAFFWARSSKVLPGYR